MKPSCVIFSCTILSIERLFVLQDFIKEFKKDFIDCDFYVGINHNSIREVEATITSSNLKLKGMMRATEDLYTNSDASGYQLALKLAKLSSTEYETYWFIHTKSGVNEHSDYLRQWYIDNFLAHRYYIENFLQKHTNIGSYGMLSRAYNPKEHYQEQDTEINLFKNVLSSDLPCTHANFFYIHTIYAIKGILVDKFFNLTTDIWFNMRLDRYYFEGIFPFIVSRLGYFPYVSNSIDLEGNNIVELNRLWIAENKLDAYTNYLELHHTDYSFHQLMPPYNQTYVNSNT